MTSAIPSGSREFTTRLHALASMDDLTKIRDSLVSSAHELQAGVNQMALDGEEAVARMRGELRQYQEKLEEAERLASLDCLTGLAEPAEDGRGVGTAGGAAHAVFGAGLRFERFQAGKRHLRTRGGGRCAGAIRQGTAGGVPRDGRCGPVGRRRIHRGAGLRHGGSAPATGAGAEMGIWRLRGARRRGAGQTPRGCIRGSGDVAGGRNASPEMFARADAEMYKEKKAAGRAPTPA